MREIISELETTIIPMEEEKRTLQKRVLKLEKKNSDVLESNVLLQSEIAELRIQLLRTSRSEKASNFAFFLSWIVFTIVLYLK